MIWVFIVVQISILFSILNRCRHNIGDLLLYKNFVPVLLIIWFTTWFLRYLLGWISVELSEVEIRRFYVYHSSLLMSIYIGSRLKSIDFSSLIGKRLSKKRISWNAIGKLALASSFAIGAALTLLLGVNGELLYEQGGDSFKFLPLTVYFSRLTRICLILFLIRYGNKKDLFSGTSLIIYLSLACLVVFVLGRRSEVVYLIIVLLSYRQYVLKIRTRIRRFITILVIGLPLVLLLPILRLHTSRFDFRELRNVEIRNELTRNLNLNESSEIYNAVLDFNAAFEGNSEVNYGYSFVNRFVHQFVSSAIFGESVKNRFLIDFNAERANARINYGKGTYLPYLTHSIVLDMYWSFGSFGIIILLFSSWLFSSLENALMRFKDRDLGLFWIMFLPTLYFSMVYDSLSRIPTLLVLPAVYLYILPKAKSLKYG